MEFLDFLTEDQMMQFFRRNKTRISCMVEPQTFINQLQDYNLVPKELYREVLRIKSKKEGVYKMLDWVENSGGQGVKQFWRCVFQDHMLQEYPVLRSLQTEIPNEINYKESDSEEKDQEQNKSATNRRKSAEKSDEEEPGPSFLPSQKKAAMKATISHNRVSSSYVKLVPYVSSTHSEFESRNILMLSEINHKKSDSEEKKSKQNKSATKRTKSAEETNEEEPGPSFLPNQKKAATKATICPLVPQQLAESLKEKPELSVTCGNKVGTLHKDKYNKSEPCIFSDGQWLNPSQFEKVGGKKQQKKWKESIYCDGFRLNVLIKEGILPLSSFISKHSQNKGELQLENDSDDNSITCPTDSHSGSRSTPYCNDPDQVKDHACCICNEEGLLICCKQCPRAFHCECHLPMLQHKTRRDNWMCTFCIVKTNQQSQIPNRREDILKSPVHGNIKRCQYLLLCMYDRDKLNVFTDNPLTDVELSSGTSETMWLNKVKTKLQDNKYKTVGDFVDDLNLIFSKLNNDNDFFCQMRAGLRELFESEFQSTFRIHNPQFL